MKGNEHTVWKVFQHPTTKWIYQLTKENGGRKWLCFQPTSENEKVFNRTAGAPCLAPHNAFQTSFRSTSRTTWVIYDPGGAANVNKTKKGKRKIDQPRGYIFTSRLLGANLWTLSKMKKLVKLLYP